MKRIVLACAIALSVSPTLAQVNLSAAETALKPFVKAPHFEKAGDGKTAKVRWELKKIYGGAEAIGNDRNNLRSVGLHCSLKKPELDDCRKIATRLFAAYIPPVLIDPNSWFDAQLKDSPPDGSAHITSLPEFNIEFSNVFGELFLKVVRK